MTLTRSWSNESIKLELVNKTVPELLQLNEFNVFHFNYVLFPGNYSITFRHCDIIDIDNLAFGCEPIQDAITSGEIYMDFRNIIAYIFRHYSYHQVFVYYFMIIIIVGIIPVRKSLPGVESSWCLRLEVCSIFHKYIPNQWLNFERKCLKNPKIF